MIDTSFAEKIFFRINSNNPNLTPQLDHYLSYQDDYDNLDITPQTWAYLSYIHYQEQTSIDDLLFIEEDNKLYKYTYINPKKAGNALACIKMKSPSILSEHLEAAVRAGLLERKSKKITIRQWNKRTNRVEPFEVKKFYYKLTHLFYKYINPSIGSQVLRLVKKNLITSQFMDLQGEVKKFFNKFLTTTLIQPLRDLFDNISHKNYQQLLFNHFNQLIANLKSVYNYNRKKTTKNVPLLIYRRKEWYRDEGLSSRSMRYILDKLEELGFIRQVIGRYVDKKVTEVWLEESIIKIFNQCQYEPKHTDSKLTIKYEDNYRRDYDNKELLNKLNEIRQYQISTNKWNINKQTYKDTICEDRSLTYFNNDGFLMDEYMNVDMHLIGDVNRGGRPTSGYQNMKKVVRRVLQYDDWETIELDYRANHPTILYAMIGKELSGDPYIIDGIDRGIVKLAFNCVTNCRSKTGALNSFKNELHERGIVKGLTKSLKSIFKVIERHFSEVSCYFYRGIGLELQYWEGLIMLEILDMCMGMGIPFLHVYDSIVVPEYCKHNAKEIMMKAFEKITGCKTVVRDK
jgi:DNA-binding MarR family transcriptional regulator